MPLNTDADAMLMMRPPPCLIISGTTARMHRNWLVRFSRSVSSHSAIVVSASALPESAPPALFTSTSTRPKRSRTPRTASPTAASSHASATQAWTSSDSARAAASAARPAVASRSSARTVKPARASPRTCDRPMPCAPPVTRATRAALTLVRLLLVRPELLLRHLELLQDEDHLAVRVDGHAADDSLIVLDGGERVAHLLAVGGAGALHRIGDHHRRVVAVRRKLARKRVVLRLVGLHEPLNRRVRIARVVARDEQYAVGGIAGEADQLRVEERRARHEGRLEAHLARLLQQQRRLDLEEREQRHVGIAPADRGDERLEVLVGRVDELGRHHLGAVRL